MCRCICCTSSFYEYLITVRKRTFISLIVLGFYTGSSVTPKYGTHFLLLNVITNENTVKWIHLDTMPALCDWIPHLQVPVILVSPWIKNHLPWLVPLIVYRGKFVSWRATCSGNTLFSFIITSKTFLLNLSNISVCKSI